MDTTDDLTYEIFSILESKFLFSHQSIIPRPLSPPPPQRGKVRILSIDASLSFPDALLVSLALSHLRLSPLSRFFDLAAGSGHGALLASLLFSPSPLPPEHLPSLLSHHRHLLWPLPTNPSPASCWPRSPRRRRRRRSAELDGWLQKMIGESPTLKDAVKPLLITCYDMSSSAPMVFSRADAVESGRFDFRLWEVCRASLAEPARFEPVSMQSIDGSRQFVAVDGGLATANPTSVAITHVIHNKQEFPFVRGVEDLMVLSLGRGPTGTWFEGLDRVGDWRAAEWAGPVREITNGASAELVDHSIGMAFANNQCSTNYLRIQMGRPGPANAGVEEMMTVAEAELGQKNVESVMFGGRRIGEHTNAQRLEQFASSLTLEDCLRNSRIVPTVAFKQVAQPPVVAPDWKAVDVGKM